jgi:ABC-2 type transport system ATP-binding protein
MDIIEISHLSKSYGRSRGIGDLTLSVTQGDIFGFIGPNGAGKLMVLSAISAHSNG